MRARRPVLGLLLALLLLTLPPGASAGTVDPEGACTLTVWFFIGTQPAAGVTFSLWQVAEVGEQGEITMLHGLADLDPEDAALSAKVSALAETLAETAPDKTAATDASGGAVFGGLTPGLYVVAGGAYRYNGRRYTPVPALAVLPHDSGGGWSYDGEIEVKSVATASLTVSQTVTGSMGSRTEEFAFTATFTDAEDAPLAGTYGGLTLDGEGRCSFTLRHGESVTLPDLPVGVQWALTQTAADGYTVSTEAGGVTQSGGARSGMLLADTEVRFVSGRDVSLITSVDEQLAAMRVLAGGLLATGLAGTAGILLHRRRKGGRQ